MRHREPHRLPDEQTAMLARAVRLQWVSIGFLLSIITVMGLTMSASQAMRTAWAEDALSLVPPAAFLIAARYHKRAPNPHYPYGYHRVMSIAFLVAAVALCAFGIALLGDAVITLLRKEHPTIGAVELFGHQVWMGWLMIASLAYSVVPPVVLGRMKLPLARGLHAKALYADAQMNKADWATGLAAMVGILGVGFGLWWADSLAAGVISFSVVKDGVSALKTVIGDLMDRAPRPVDEHESFDVVEQLERYLDGVPWVGEYDIRLREEGDVCVGEIFLVPKSEENLTRRLEQVTEEARALDYRLYDLVVTALSTLPPQNGKKLGDRESAS
jgi:cation diffusion facilitator family transporter